MEEVTRISMSSSKQSEWCTPPKIIDSIKELGPIALDPCSNICSLVGAKKEVRPPEDGLSLSWCDEVERVGGGLIYVNPPYGREVKHWVRKCVEESRNLRQGPSHAWGIVLLCAARVDTRWFQDYVFETADQICFLKGRVRFINGLTGEQGDPAFFPSAIAYWGYDDRTLSDRSFGGIFEEKGAIR